MHVLENILRRIFSCKRQICYYCYISFFLRSAVCGAYIPATADIVLNISIICYEYLLHLIEVQMFQIDKFTRHISHLMQ